MTNPQKKSRVQEAVFTLDSWTAFICQRQASGNSQDPIRIPCTLSLSRDGKQVEVIASEASTGQFQALIIPVHGKKPVLPPGRPDKNVVVIFWWNFKTGAFEGRIFYLNEWIPITRVGINGPLGGCRFGTPPIGPAVWHSPDAVLPCHFDHDLEDSALRDAAALNRLAGMSDRLGEDAMLRYVAAHIHVAGANSTGGTLAYNLCRNRCVKHVTVSSPALVTPNLVNTTPWFLPSTLHQMQCSALRQYLTVQGAKASELQYSLSAQTVHDFFTCCSPIVLVCAEDTLGEIVHAGLLGVAYLRPVLFLSKVRIQKGSTSVVGGLAQVIVPGNRVACPICLSRFEGVSHSTSAQFDPWAVEKSQWQSEQEHYKIVDRGLVNIGLGLLDRLFMGELTGPEAILFTPNSDGEPEVITHTQGSRHSGKCLCQFYGSGRDGIQRALESLQRTPSPFLLN